MLRRMMVMSLLLFGVWGMTGAQGAPAQIEDALSALNARLGTSLTLNDVYWSWSQFNAPDSSLGCPQEGEFYTQVPVVTYRFTFEYAGETYDYRVTADRSQTRLCENPPEDADAHAAADPLSNRLCETPAEGVHYMRSRLAVGVEGRVTLSRLPNRLRAEPTTDSAIVAEIPSGGVFEVVGAAVCDATQDIVWWQVLYNGVTGWTAEGQAGEYFIEPVPLASALPALAPIDGVNVGTLRELAALQGNIGRRVAYTADGVLVAVGDVGAEGLWLYDDLTQAPRLVPLESRLTQLAPTQTADRLAVGGEDGTVSLLNPLPDAKTVARVVFNGHQDPVDAIAFDAENGFFMASSGGVAYTTQASESPFAVMLWDLDDVYLKGVFTGQTDTVTAIAFVPQSDVMLYASLDGSVRVVSLEHMIETVTIKAEIGVSSLAVSADGALAVAGYMDGSIMVIDLVTYHAYAPTFAHRGVVNALTFSPDAALLATVGSDDQLRLWTVADLTTDQPRQWTFNAGHGGTVYDVAFSPDGTQLATVGADRHIRLWGIAQ